MHHPLSYIEISAPKLKQNILIFKKQLHQNTKIAAVIKANAYGHGQNEIARCIDPLVDYFQVDDALELKKLREVSAKKTLVLGYVAKQELPYVIAHHGIFTLSDYERIQAIHETAKKLHTNAHVHIKIDALLGRQGLLEPDVERFLDVMRPYHNIHIDGFYSHFSNIEDTSDFSHAKKQIETFRRIQKLFSAHGYDVDHHISATSGILVYEKGRGHNSIVRLGIGMYGMWPSEDLQKRYETVTLTLHPVLRWVSHIAQIKTVPKNYPIGYGCTYKTKKQTTIAVIPQGYSDGFDRGFSNNGDVLIHESRCPVIGRVAMNMFVVDVSAIDNPKQYDEVVLLGQQGKNHIAAEEMARRIDTINYEITTRISPLLPRIVIP